jgi:hypothetical protein
MRHTPTPLEGRPLTGITPNTLPRPLAPGAKVRYVEARSGRQRIGYVLRYAVRGAVKGHALVRNAAEPSRTEYVHPAKLREVK